MDSGAKMPFRGVVLGLLAVAVIYGLYARWHALRQPPVQTDGVNGLIARNYLKYGFRDFGLAQIVSPGPVLPEAERVYYQTHPPLAPMLGALGVAVLGPTTGALRLPHVLLSLATVVLLAWLAARLYGPMAGLWAALAGAALPIASTYGSAWPEPLGPALIFFTVLSAGLYHRYAAEGRVRDLGLLVAAVVLALAADWPAHVMAFALAGHALAYRTKARKVAMLALPALALLALAGLMLYARAIPEKQNLYGSLSGMLAGWTGGEGGPDQVPSLSLVGWVAGFAVKYVEQFSPLALLAPVWALACLPAAFRRENHPDQHLLLLWVWPLVFTAALHRIFAVHVHYHLVFLPAVAVSLGALGAWACSKAAARLPRLGALGATAAALFVILWSYQVVVAREDRLTPLRRQQVAWAQELAGTMPFQEHAAFVTHYALQMRFLADRRLEEYVDSVAKVDALRGSGQVERLFAPLGQPFGDDGFGRELLSRFDARAGGRLVAFGLGSPRSGLAPAVVPVGSVRLSGGATVEGLEWAVFGAGQRQLLYLGWRLREAPRVRPGEALAWKVRYVRRDGRGLELTMGEATSPAVPSASCFYPVPADWSAATGRVELTLVLRTWDVASQGLVGRVARWAMRFVTLGRLGAPVPAEKPFLVEGREPIVLAAPGAVRRPEGH